MRRPGSPQGTQSSDLPTVQAELAEDRLLTPRQVRSDAAQASRHLECSHVEVRAGLVPVVEQAIGEVVIHDRIIGYQSP